MEMTIKCHIQVIEEIPDLGTLIADAMKAVEKFGYEDLEVEISIRIYPQIRKENPNDGSKF